MNVNGKIIKENKTCKILGITLNNRLNWNDNLSALKSTLRSRIMVLKRLKYRIPSSQLRKVAIAIFISKILYGITVYGAAKLEHGDPLPGTTKSLQVIANTMMRLIKHGKNPTLE